MGMRSGSTGMRVSCGCCHARLAGPSLAFSQQLMVIRYARCTSASHVVHGREGHRLSPLRREADRWRGAVIDRQCCCVCTFRCPVLLERERDGRLHRPVADRSLQHTHRLQKGRRRRQGPADPDRHRRRRQVGACARPSERHGDGTVRVPRAARGDTGRRGEPELPWTAGRWRHGEVLPDSRGLAAQDGLVAVAMSMYDLVVLRWLVRREMARSSGAIP